MRAILTTLTLGLAVLAWNPVLAQEPAPPAAQAPTPEAAARFIDSVVGNGVSIVTYLQTSGSGESFDVPAESSQTANCKTVIRNPRGENGRNVFEVDWTSFVAADSFFKPTVTDAWGARVLAKTTTKLTANDDITKVNPYSIKQVVGLMVEPGTAELKDRLIRAMEFYGKSCAPTLDGPF